MYGKSKEKTVNNNNIPLVFTLDDHRPRMIYNPLKNIHAIFGSKYN